MILNNTKVEGRLKPLAEVSNIYGNFLVSCSYTFFSSAYLSQAQFW